MRLGEKSVCASLGIPVSSVGAIDCVRTDDWSLSLLCKLPLSQCARSNRKGYEDLRDGAVNLMFTVGLASGEVERKPVMAESVITCKRRLPLPDLGQFNMKTGMGFPLMAVMFSLNELIFHPIFYMSR